MNLTFVRSDLRLKLYNKCNTKRINVFITYFICQSEDNKTGC